LAVEEGRKNKPFAAMSTVIASEVILTGILKRNVMEISNLSNLLFVLSFHVGLLCLAFLAKAQILRIHMSTTTRHVGGLRVLCASL
jgi:hypothetical protein